MTTHSSNAQGVNPLVRDMPQHTCGEACWEAREDVCRCSCGGKNHGCMRDPSGPQRSARIDGVRYLLRAVGTDVYDEAAAINSSNHHVKIGSWEHDYPWSTTDKGAPARVKNASKDQLARWPELASYRRQIEEIKQSAHPSPLAGHAWIDIERAWPQLLWVREDINVEVTP